MPRQPTRRAAVLLPLILAGCGSLLSGRPYIETKRFVLAPHRAGAPAARRPRRTILIRTLRAAPGMDRRGLRSVLADGTEDIDFYAEWAAAPVDAAEQALRDWVGASGLFSAVLAPGSRADADVTLEGELTELAAFPGQGEARAGLSVVLLDPRGRVLSQTRAVGRAPLTDAGRTPEARAAAMTAALGDAFAGLEPALRRVA